MKNKHVDEFPSIKNLISLINENKNILDEKPIMLSLENKWKTDKKSPEFIVEFHSLLNQIVKKTTAVPDKYKKTFISPILKHIKKRDKPNVNAKQKYINQKVNDKDISLIDLEYIIKDFCSNCNSLLSSIEKDIKKTDNNKQDNNKQIVLHNNIDLNYIEEFRKDIETLNYSAMVLIKKIKNLIVLNTTKNIDTIEEGLNKSLNDLQKEFTIKNIEEILKDTKFLDSKDIITGNIKNIASSLITFFNKPYEQKESLLLKNMLKKLLKQNYKHLYKNDTAVLIKYIFNFIDTILSIKNNSGYSYTILKEELIKNLNQNKKIIFKKELSQKLKMEQIITSITLSNNEEIEKTFHEFYKLEESNELKEIEYLKKKLTPIIIDEIAIKFLNLIKEMNENTKISDLKETIIDIIDNNFENISIPDNSLDLKLINSLKTITQA